MTKKRPSTTRGEGTPKSTAGKKAGCGCLLLIALAILLFGGCSALMVSGSDDTQPSSAPSVSLAQEPTADPSGDLLSTFVATPGEHRTRERLRASRNARTPWKATRPPLSCKLTFKSPRTLRRP